MKKYMYMYAYGKAYIKTEICKHICEETNFFLVLSFICNTSTFNPCHVE